MQRIGPSRTGVPHRRRKAQLQNAPARDSPQDRLKPGLQLSIRSAAMTPTAPLLDHVRRWLDATAGAARRDRRRRAIESRHPSQSVRDPLEDLSACEFLAILDAEIERLPETERLPLILCCLDGLSLDEAASRLGVTPGAVKGRLER